MADTVLLLKQIQLIFGSLVQTILKLDPATDTTVRSTWPTGGQPSWKITDDIVFIRITEQDDKLARQQNIYYGSNDSISSNQETGYTRVHRVDFTLYGPNSYDNADLIRYQIFNQDNTNILKRSNLFLVTDVPMVQRAPELYNGQWWERTDFSALFNESVIRRKIVPYITSPNFVILESE